MEFDDGNNDVSEISKASSTLRVEYSRKLARANAQLKRIWRPVSCWGTASVEYVGKPGLRQHW